MVNARSGRAALAEFGLTTTTDDDRLVPAVRLLRPDQHQVTPEKVFEESAWSEIDEAGWRAAWEGEVAGTDPWRARRLTLATGLLLPIWGKLPSKGCSVRRVRAPDGRRWLGRVLDEVQAASLKTALGLTEVGDAWADGGRTAAAVLDRNVQLALSGGFGSSDQGSWTAGGWKWSGAAPTVTPWSRLAASLRSSPTRHACSVPSTDLRSWRLSCDATPCNPSWRVP